MFFEKFQKICQSRKRAKTRLGEDEQKCQNPFFFFFLFVFTFFRGGEGRKTICGIILFIKSEPEKKKFAKVAYLVILDHMFPTTTRLFSYFNSFPDLGLVPKLR